MPKKILRDFLTQHFLYTRSCHRKINCLRGCWSVRFCPIFKKKYNKKMFWDKKINVQIIWKKKKNHYSWSFLILKPDLTFKLNTVHAFFHKNINQIFFYLCLSGKASQDEFSPWLSFPAYFLFTWRIRPTTLKRRIISIVRTNRCFHLAASCVWADQASTAKGLLSKRSAVSGLNPLDRITDTQMVVSR